METARDRIAGILIGNVVVFVIFTLIWPITIASVVRPALAQAMEQLAALLQLGHRESRGPDADVVRLRRSFEAAINQARSVLVNNPYEDRTVRRIDDQQGVDMTVLLQVQALMVTVLAIQETRAVDGGEDPFGTIHGTALLPYDAMADWFRRSATWLRNGDDAEQVRMGLPDFPDASGSDASRSIADPHTDSLIWYRLLHHDIRSILDELGLPTRRATEISIWKTEVATG